MTAVRGDGGVRATVVVPVYDAGDWLERCAPSLVGQSLPADEYEVLYVDDGSTDGSAAVLDDLARRHRHVRVIHQENSGWPGKPRNVGIAAARGAYVQFVDQDDELMPDALERLVALGDRTAADVVIGKLVGGMTGPRAIFAHDVEGGTVLGSGAVLTLTGHKLFRRAFLEQHRIRFPEGYWRMEDLLFVARAYLADPVVSVLAEHACYRWNARADGRNSSRAAYDLEGHYERLQVLLREAVAVLECGDPDRAAIAEALLRRYVGIEILTQTSVGSRRRRDRRQAARSFELAGAVLRGLPERARQGLECLPAARVACLVAGDAEGHEALLSRAAQVVPFVREAQACWSQGRLVVRARVEWTNTHLLADLALLAPVPADTEASVTGLVHSRRRGEWWWRESEGDTLTLDPAALPAGETLRVALGCGWAGLHRRARRSADAVVVLPRPLVRRGRVHLVTPGGTRTLLGLRTVPAARWLARELGRTSPRTRHWLTAAELRVPVATGLDASSPDDVLRPRSSTPARLELGAGRAWLVLDRRTPLPSGTQRVRVAGHVVGEARVARGRLLWFRPGGAPEVSG